MKKIAGVLLCIVLLTGSLAAHAQFQAQVQSTVPVAAGPFKAKSFDLFVDAGYPGFTLTQVSLEECFNILLSYSKAQRNMRYAAVCMDRRNRERAYRIECEAGNSFKETGTPCRYGFTESQTYSLEGAEPKPVLKLNVKQPQP